MRGSNAITCVAVRVVAPTAVSVKVTFVSVACVNAPVTVPDVNGVVSTSGESMPSVFVICALAGSAV